MLVAAATLLRLAATAASSGLPGSSSGCSIIDHGAKPGNATADAVANAQAIQRALASCAKVTVPAGAFKITPIVLPSHSELYLEHGASLVGSERWRDYGRSHMLPPMGNSGTQPGMFMVKPLISATDATNVTISGANGTIDGNGWVFWPTANWSSPECGIRSHCASTPFTDSDAPGALRPPQLLTFTRSSWITITNVTIANPPYWGLQHFFCNDTYMSHVTILAPRWTRQIAGFMPFSTLRYTVEDSYVEALGTTRRRHRDHERPGLSQWPGLQRVEPVPGVAAVHAGGRLRLPPRVHSRSVGRHRERGVRPLYLTVSSWPPRGQLVESTYLQSI